MNHARITPVREARPAAGAFEVAHAAGFTPDARFDMAGFRAMLALRAEIEGGGGAPIAPEKYLDLSYTARALEGVGR